MCSLECSVIITTKNRQDFLKRALSSIASQTVQPKEIIIVDDHSDEKFSYEEYSENFNFDVKYIYNLESKGGNYSRNLGVKTSNFDIIMFLDDDDFWLENKIKTQLDVFEKDTEKEIGLVYTGKKFVYSNDLDNVTRLSKESNLYKRDDIFHVNFPGSTSGVALRRSDFYLAGEFDEKLESMQDYDLWIRVIKNKRFFWDEAHNLVYTVHKNKDKNNQISSNANKHKKSLLRIECKYKKDIENLSFINKQKFISRKNHIIASAFKKNKDYRFFKYYIYAVFSFPNLKSLALPIVG